eukprot:TRINITY_DN9373_c0_g1_i1.p1 TRINITY_DN9373_c0_g1~~TRINITY_DN9373_c0_g1_i1.p1  ORF type:complete len:1319 (+),score=321.64 TRINITY_DN9373_c0_g1_i1:97-3957(+)
MAEQDASQGGYAASSPRKSSSGRAGWEGSSPQVKSPVQRISSALRNFRRVFDGPPPQDVEEACPLNVSFEASASGSAPGSPPRQRRARARDTGDLSAWSHERVCEEAVRRLALSRGSAGMGDFDFMRFIGQIMAALRSTLARQDLSVRELGDCLVTALCCETLGHCADFAYIHAVNLTALPDVPLRLKRLGYLLCGLCLPPGDERLLLLVNNIQKDLRSEESGTVAIALAACVRVITEDSWPVVCDQVWRCLEHRDNLVRKRAMLALQHFHRLAGKHALSINFTTPAEFAMRLLSHETLAVAGLTLPALNFAAEVIPAVDVRHASICSPEGADRQTPVTGLLERVCSLADAMIFPHLQPGLFSEAVRPGLFTQLALLRVLGAVCDKAAACGGVEQDMALRIGEVFHGFLKKAWRQGAEGMVSSPLGRGEGAPKELPPTAAAIVHQVLQVMSRPGVLPLARMPELAHVVQAGSACVEPMFASKDANRRYVALRCCSLLASIDDDEARNRQKHIVNAFHSADAPVIMAAAEVLSQMARPDNVRAVVRRLMGFARRPPRSWRLAGSDAAAAIRRHLVARCYGVAWRVAGGPRPMTLLWALTELPRRFPQLPPPHLPSALRERGTATPDQHSAAPTPPGERPEGGGRARADAAAAAAPARSRRLEEHAQGVLAWLRDALALQAWERLPVPAAGGAPDADAPDADAPDADAPDADAPDAGAGSDPEETEARREFRGRCCDLLGGCLSDGGDGPAHNDALAVGVVARGTAMLGRLRPLPTRAAAWALGEAGAWHGERHISAVCCTLCDALEGGAQLKSLLAQEGGGVAAAGALLALTKLVCLYTHLRLSGCPTVIAGRDTALSTEVLLRIKETFASCCTCGDTTVAAAAEEGAALLRVALAALSEAAAAQTTGDFFGCEMGTARPLFEALARPWATAERVEDDVDASLGALAGFVAQRSAELRAEGRHVREYVPRHLRRRDSGSSGASLRFAAYASGIHGAAEDAPVEPGDAVKLRLNVPQATKQKWGREGYAGLAAVRSPSPSGSSVSGAAEESASDDESDATGLLVTSEDGSAAARRAPRRKQRGAWMTRAIALAAAAADPPPPGPGPAAASAGAPPPLAAGGAEGGWSDSVLQVAPAAGSKRWGPRCIAPAAPPAPAAASPTQELGAPGGRRGRASSGAAGQRRPRRKAKRQSAYQQLAEDAAGEGPADEVLAAPVAVAAGAFAEQLLPDGSHRSPVHVSPQATPVQSACASSLTGATPSTPLPPPALQQGQQQQGGGRLPPRPSSAAG